MKKNEVANVTANEAFEITARGQKRVTQYFNAVEKMNKSAWATVKVVYDTVTAETFEADFGSMARYADAIEMSKASVTLMKKAFEIRTKYEKELEGFTYTAVTKLIGFPFDDADIESFLEGWGITAKSSASDVEKAVKQLKTGLEAKDVVDVEATEVETTEDEGEAEESCKDEPVATVEVPANANLVIIDGKVFNLTADDVEAIKEILGLE